MKGVKVETKSTRRICYEEKTREYIDFCVDYRTYHWIWNL